MRKFRTISIVAFAAIMTAAFAVPAGASASVGWTFIGAPIKSAKTIELDGTLRSTALVNGSGVVCTIHGKATLSPGTEGEIATPEVKAETCAGSGTEWKLCSGVSATVGGAWHLQAVEEKETSRILITNVSYTVTVHNCKTAPTTRTVEIKATGAIKATPNNVKAMSSLSLAGEGTQTVEGTALSSSLSGSLEITPIATYGIVEYAAPNILWASGGIALTTPVTITLSGYASYNHLGQGYTCTVKGKATLYPGNEGSMTEYSIQPATCIGTGGLWKGCEVTSATASTPWPIQAIREGEKKYIHVNGFSYVLHLKAKVGQTCGHSIWEVAGGNINMTPDNPSGFSTLLLAGEVFAGGEGSGMGDVLSVSPAGTYGLL